MCVCVYACVHVCVCMWYVCVHAVCVCVQGCDMGGIWARQGSTVSCGMSCCVNSFPPTVTYCV